MQLYGIVTHEGRGPLPGGFSAPRLFHYSPPLWPVLRRPIGPAAFSPLAAPIILSRPVVSERQLMLLFQPTRLTPLALHIEGILRRLARNGEEMPDNPTLGVIAGGHGRSAVFRILARLEAAGVIQIEKEAARRRVRVLDINRCTDWGPARPGHAPYTQRARGAPRPVVIKPQIIRLAAPARVYDPDDDVAVDVCQYILDNGFDDDRYHARAPEMCGRAVMRGKSWCVGHHALLTRPGQALSERRIELEARYGD